MRLAGQAKGGFYPTPDRVTQRIISLIGLDKPHTNTPTHHTLIDPCCGNGDALRDIRDHLALSEPSTLTTYGVELHKDRAAQAGEFLDHTLALDIFQTSIANNAFGLLFLNPPYDFDSDEDSSRRLEHSFLTYCTRYLQPSGILVLIIPQIRLSTSANYIASHYDDIECFSFPDPEWDDFNQVVLFATRKENPSSNPPQARIILDMAFTRPPILPEDDFPNHYIPSNYSRDLLFANRVIDPLESAKLARASGLWTSPLIQDALWPGVTKRTKPLMPLRRGHMAMFIAAGLVDNISLEGDDHRRIIVKGRVEKNLQLAETDDKSETYRERMTTSVISLDLDTGEFDKIL